MTATTTQEATALVATPRQQFDLSPQTFEQALQFAEYLASSEMVPKGYRGRPGDCLVAMQWGYEIGLKPLQALQSIATINGKPGIFGDAGKAILLSNGCIIEEDDIEIVEKNCKARCKITRPGRPPVDRTYSLDNAKTAGLWNKEGPWRTNPWRQMAWRAFWFAARDAAADLLRGLGGAEELVDYQPEPKNMGPAEVVPASEKPALPDCPAENFEKKLPAWKKNVEDGGKVSDLLAMLQSKYTLSPEQIEKINALGQTAEPAPAMTADQADFAAQLD